MSDFREADPHLVWHNKDKYLLSRSGDTHEWVEATDPRLSETRRLREIGTFGVDPHDNLLIHGDARHALDALAGLPEFAQQYVGQVKLAYIDPPFNTGNTFRHYRDRAEQSVWLTVFCDTLTRIKSLLSDDGSVWVHLDNSEQHRARAVLDEVFGPGNFVSTVIWEKTNTPRVTANAPSIRHDYIHIYRKSPSFTMRRLPSGADKSPRRVGTLWNLDDVGSGREGSAESRRLFDEPFATPKPERLLARVITLATDPGDTVLDCFSGSGTTAAVAHKLGRRWVSVEVNGRIVSDFLEPRLAQVVLGTDDDGISVDAGWSGGGGFTRVDVEPSTFEMTSTTKTAWGTTNYSEYLTTKAVSATDRTERGRRPRPASPTDRPTRSSMRWQHAIAIPSHTNESDGIRGDHEVLPTVDLYCRRCGRRFEDDTRFCGGCSARRGR